MTIDGHGVRPWGRRDDFLVFAALLTTYVATLHPSVAGGDSGELIAAAWTGGVAHPPGYPLFTLLAGLFARVVAVGEVAWRVNLFTALCAAAAATVLRRLVAEWGGSRVAAAAAALLFGLSPLIWTWAVAAEVFSLNNLCLAALLLIAWRWTRSGAPRLAWLGAFVLGLGLANHHTLLLIAGPLAGWMLYRGRARLLRPRALAGLTASFAAGLAPYLYLPLAAAADPEIAWGETATPAGFLHHLLRRDYGTLRLGGETAAGSYVAELWSQYARSVAHNTLLVGWLLAVVGCVVSLRRRAAADDADPRPAVGAHELGRALLAAWLVYLAVFGYAANLPVDRPLFREVTARFWQLPHLVVFVWIGLGLAWVARRARRRAWVLAAALVAVALQAGLHVGQADQHRNRYVADYAAALLEPLPPDAVLLTSGDLVTNSVRYLQSCAGARRDVTVIDLSLATRPWYVRRLAARHPDLVFPAARYHPGLPDGFSLGAWLAANRGREVWIYPEFRDDDPSTAGYELWPVGLPSRIVAAGSTTDAAPGRWRREAEAARARLHASPWPAPERYGPGTWERVVLDDLWQADHRLGVRLLTLAIARGDDAGLLGDARALLESVAEDQPDPPFQVFKNLGIAYDHARAADPSLLERRDAAWRRYLRLAPANDPDRQAIAAALQ